MTRIKPPALPDGGTIAVVAPSSPPQTRSEIEQATDVLPRAAATTLVFGPQPPRGPRLPRRHRRAARRRPAVGAERAGDRHGPVLRRRLRRRAAVPADRLGRARRPADLLRLQRHHGAAPRARQARPVDHVLRPDVPALHAQEGRADRRVTEECVPPRLQGRAARPRARGSRRPVRADRRRGRRRGADRRRLPDARGRQPRHAVRDRDRRLHRAARGPQRGAVHRSTRTSTT